MASGRRKALIIANDEYQNPELKSLRSPAIRVRWQRVW
jgi:hypothetical protein